jgi:hypothetical protein
MEWVSREKEENRFNAWKRGRTGFPIVDAAMRELYATGWMTQSIRMVAASFLVEYLRVNWTKGCEWFHYTLADSDSAINAMMWQNAGKSGIDQVGLSMNATCTRHYKLILLSHNDSITFLIYSGILYYLQQPHHRIQAVITHDDGFQVSWLIFDDEHKSR